MPVLLGHSLSITLNSYLNESKIFAMLVNLASSNYIISDILQSVWRMSWISNLASAMRIELRKLRSGNGKQNETPTICISAMLKSVIKHRSHRFKVEREGFLKLGETHRINLYRTRS